VPTRKKSPENRSRTNNCCTQGLRPYRQPITYAALTSVLRIMSRSSWFSCGAAISLQIRTPCPRRRVTGSSYHEVISFKGQRVTEPVSRFRAVPVRRGPTGLGEHPDVLGDAVPGSRLRETGPATGVVLDRFLNSTAENRSSHADSRTGLRRCAAGAGKRPLRGTHVEVRHASGCRRSEEATDQRSGYPEPNASRLMQR
jgi:hypothetical protein